LDDVGVGAQRRVDLVKRVVPTQPLISEEQVVWGHLRTHRDTTLLGSTQTLDTAPGRDMTHVQPRPRVFREQTVPRDDRLFRRGRPARVTEPGRLLTLVRLRS